MAKRIMKHTSTAHPNRGWAHCSFHYLSALSFADMQRPRSSSFHDLIGNKIIVLSCNTISLCLGKNNQEVCFCS